VFALALAVTMVSAFAPSAAALTGDSPPAPPTAVVAERVDEATVRVAWMPPADEGSVDAYHVYRADGPAGAFERVGTTENATFTDPAAPEEAGPFWYAVSAENEHGESAEAGPAPELAETTCIVVSPNHVPPFHIDFGHCPGPDPGDPTEVLPGSGADGLLAFRPDGACGSGSPLNVRTPTC
jgi:hypothetical protein